MGYIKYPILLVHGIGFHDSKILNYWGRIPRKLEENGAQIFYGNQDSHGSVENNARFLYNRVQEILAKTGAKKVNVIAHSKGGLDCRWMITNLDHGEHIATLTTIATPHHGSHTVDLLLRLPDGLVRMAAFFCNLWYRMVGDKNPDAYTVFHGLSTEKAKQFNEENKDVDGVFYQSYAFVMKRMWSDILLWFPYLVILLIEGKSDGLVTPKSAVWGEFRGTFTGSGRRGISHCDEVDLRRRPFDKKESHKEGTIADITEFYCGVVEELAKRGF